MAGSFVEMSVTLLLIVLNGVFSMSETAFVSARKARLQQRADKGPRDAQRAENKQAINAAWQGKERHTESFIDQRGLPGHILSVRGTSKARWFSLTLQAEGSSQRRRQREQEKRGW
jgi:hypothetical protein